MPIECGLWDTHAHIETLVGTYGAEKLVESSRNAGISHIVAVGGSEDGNREAAKISSQYPEFVLHAVGYDRYCVADGRNKGDLAPLEILPTTRAIGEIGIDLHYDPDGCATQMDLMGDQLALARTRGLPVIVHSRNSDDQTIELLSDHVSRVDSLSGRIGVVHCFTGGQVFLERILELGFYVSYSGIVTFRNADLLRSTVPNVPVDRLLVETDSPYLAPEPVRGKHNVPWNLPHTVSCLGRILGLTAREVAQITSENADRLFCGH